LLLDAQHKHKNKSQQNGGFGKKEKKERNLGLARLLLLVQYSFVFENHQKKSNASGGPAGHVERHCGFARFFGHGEAAVKVAQNEKKVSVI
jgi:hypothetical protein